MAAFSGFGGRVFVSGSALPATRWQVMWKTDALDVTNFEVLGGPSNTNGLSAPPGPPTTNASQFSQSGTDAYGGVATPVSAWCPGITDMDVTVDCYWDSAVSPFIKAAPLVVPGLIVTCKLFYDRSNAGHLWGPVDILIDSVSMDDEVRGVIKWSFSGKVAGFGTGITSQAPPL